jgi:hypothetical protein
MNRFSIGYRCWTSYISRAAWPRLACEHWRFATASSHVYPSHPCSVLHQRRLETHPLHQIASTSHHFGTANLRRGSRKALLLPLSRIRSVLDSWEFHVIMVKDRRVGSPSARADRPSFRRHCSALGLAASRSCELSASRYVFTVQKFRDTRLFCEPSP